MADLLVVVADGPAGPVCAEVSGAAAGLRRSRLAALDQTRELAAIEFRDVPATLIGAPDGPGGGSAPPAAARVAARAAQLGALQAAGNDGALP